ncbi:PAS domain-containing sensor histidine kinase [Nonomuraea diastatica]|uniref:histidine kinase n=1 Tax=Nonomuraea diastatica TaxID=1848329 RepID=A0A4R4WB03_9ACTN|nr:PAS domain-containing sensor histidine kinase [Nonomuraea diastatica]TDD13104.1 PAS domain-containing sensor histidine kinase [Nonomuraea diastatica]
MMGAQVDYRAVFEAVPSPCVVLTPDQVVVAVNDAYVRVIGRDREDVVGRDAFTSFPGKLRVLGDPEASGVTEVRASLERVVNTGVADVVPLLGHGMEAPDRPGAFEEGYWCLLNVPMLDAAGGVRWIVVVVEDVTGLFEQVRASLGAGATRAGATRVGVRIPGQVPDPVELSSRLQQAYRQEQRAVSALHEAIEHQQRFLFDATHDLRNPITGLLTEMEVALADPDADLRQTLQTLHHNVERLNNVVTDLLVLARLYTATPPTTDLVDLADLAMEELEAHPPNANVVTHLSDNVMVRASRVRLARLLSNLVANAERHTTSKIEIVVAADPPSFAILEVIDDGPGIRPEDRERIFHRLYRQDLARRLDSGGSGFGLPIAREIAQAYGGDLYVADHADGARFVLRLPLAS